MIAWFNAKRRLSLDYKNFCRVVKVINLFYFVFVEGPNDDWTKELFSISIFQQFVAKIYGTVQTESGKIIAINGCQRS